MFINKVTIPGQDNFQLAGTLYESAPSRQVVIINTGTGILRRYYDGFAQYLCENGFTVVTYDYRGIGGSKPQSLRGLAVTMHEWGQKDIASVIDWAQQRLRPTKLFMIGHSAGGQLVGLAANNHLVDAMVFVAAQSGYWGHWPRPQRWAYAGLWHLMPLIAEVCGYLPSKYLGLGEDLPAGVAGEWAKWCRHPDYLFGYRDFLDLSNYASVAAPILAYSFADDAYAPKPAVDALLRNYSQARIVRQHVFPASINVKSIGHFGFFRKTGRDPLWRETVEWLHRQGEGAKVSL